MLQSHYPNLLSANDELHSPLLPRGTAPSGAGDVLFLGRTSWMVRPACCFRARAKVASPVGSTGALLWRGLFCLWHAWVRQPS